jgi:HEPN domain-containing protein
MPEVPLSDNVQRWIDDARSDLSLASIRKTRHIRYEHLCFHAQQAAEKSLKAVLLAHSQNIPRTHDIAFLIDQLPSEILQPPQFFMLPILTRYAVQHRYPGQDIIVARRDRDKALLLARTALLWAEQTIASKFSDADTVKA